MDSRDKRLVLAIIGAIVLWGVIDLIFSPRPLVFLYASEGSAKSVFASVSEKILKKPEAVQDNDEKDVSDLETTLPPFADKQPLMDKLIKTDYEKPYQQLFNAKNDRDDLLSLVRNEPVVEVSGLNEPTELGLNGGTINVVLRVKGYYGDIHNLKLFFVCPLGWDYIPGTSSNQIADSTVELKLASLEDKIQWTQAGEVFSEYLKDEKAEPLITLTGNPPRKSLNWQISKVLKKDQAYYLEFPLQTNGAHLPGQNEFSIQVTATDRQDSSDKKVRQLHAEVLFQVKITKDESIRLEHPPDSKNQEINMLTSGIRKRYRFPVSSVGF